MGVSLQEWLSIIDLALTSLVFGSSIWVFFLQSPALLKWMGRDKYTPVMLKITKVWSAMMVYSLLPYSVLVLDWADAVDKTPKCGVLVAFFAAVINNRLVVPAAAAASAKSSKLRRGTPAAAKDGAGVSDDASSGGKRKVAASSKVKGVKEEEDIPEVSAADKAEAARLSGKVERFQGLVVALALVQTAGIVIYSAKFIDFN